MTAELLVQVLGTLAATGLLLRRRRERQAPEFQFPRRGYWAAQPMLPYLAHAARYGEEAVLQLERHLGSAPRDAVVVLTTANETSPEPRRVQFRHGEPRSLAEYASQPHFVPFLQAEVRSMSRSRLSRPQLLLGPPGLGKTLLAKVLAHEIELELERRGKPAGDFVLALGSDIKDRQALDRLIRRAAQRPGSVLFIDEIHTLVSSENMDKWLLLLDEHRWQFLNDRDAEQLADFTIVGATTDYGALPGALRRRFAERQLQPLTAREIEGVLRNRFAVTSAAAVAAAERTHHGGTPWEAIALLTEAEVLTRDRGAAEIEVQDVEAVFRIWDLDSYGLRPHDRAVIRALLTQRREQRGRTKNDAPTILYAASEDATVAMARVDREAYRLDIRPRLMARGFLMTTSKGQTLTERAVAVYQ